MAQLFRLQCKQAELIELWHTAPSAVKEQFGHNFVEITLLKMAMFQEQSLWNKSHNLGRVILQSVRPNGPHSNDPQRVALVKSWKLWSNMLQAIESAGPMYGASIPC